MDLWGPRQAASLRDARLRTALVHIIRLLFTVGAVLAAGWPQSTSGRAAFAQLDSWLRAVSNQRNPGTTADLVTASLFAALREGIITVPYPLSWSHS